MEASEGTTAAPSTTLWHIVEESLEDAGFLWTRWERFLDAPDLRIDDVYFWVEERLQGALDGVRCAGPAAIEPLLEHALAADDVGLVSAAAHVLAAHASSVPQARELLSRALLGFSGASLGAVRRGMELAPACRPLLQQLSAAAAAAPAESQIALLDLHTSQRLDAGALLPALAAARDAGVRAAVLRACRAAVAFDARWIQHGLADDDPDVVAAAVETGLSRHQQGAWDVCLQLCRETKLPPARRQLLPLLAMSGTARANATLLHALQDDASRREVIFSLGISGKVDAARSCLELIQHGSHSRLAADAFCAITGLDLRVNQLTRETASAEPPAMLEDDDLEADLTGTQDDALPEPDVDGLNKWWAAEQRRFTETERYLQGEPITWGSLLRALERGPARWRHARARELGLRSADRARVFTRAFSQTQRQQLHQLQALTPDPLSSITGWAPLR